MAKPPADDGSRRGSARQPAAPLLPAAVVLIAGILLHGSVVESPAIWTLAVIVCVAAGWVWCGSAWISNAAIAAAVFFAGVAAAQIAHWQYPPDDISRFASDDPVLSATEWTVIDPPRLVTPQGEVQVLPPRQITQGEVTAVRTWNGWVPATGRVLVQIADPHPLIRQGQSVRTIGRLQRPAGSQNPGQFDWAAYYRDQGVLCSLSIANAENIRIIDPSPPRILDRMRWSVRRLLAEGFETLPASDHLLLRALLLGDNDTELRDIQNQFRSTGTSHHLAVSGLHVAVLGGVVLGIARLLSAGPRTALLITGGFIAVYGLMALPSPPVVRSVLLCLAMAAGLFWRSNVNATNLLSATVIAMLLYRPGDLSSPGFQLSFGTVLGLILFTSGVRRQLAGVADPLEPPARPGDSQGAPARAVRWADNALLTALAAGLVAWAVSMPMIAFHFGQLNPWAIPASLLLAPAVFASLVGGLMKIVLTGVFPGMAGVWAAIAARPIEAMQWTVDKLARLPGSDIPLPPPPIWLIIVYFIALALAFRPTPHPGLRWIFRLSPVLAAGAMLVLPFHARLPRAEGVGTLRVTLLSVGSGQCAVVEPPGGRTLLLDAGSASLADLHGKALGPFLRARGYTHLDTVLVSNPDMDHFSGIPEAVRRYGVREVLVGPNFHPQAAQDPAVGELLRLLRSQQRPPRIVGPGQRIPLGRDTELLILWPNDDPALADNDASVVVKLTHAGRSILFPGDVQDTAMHAVAAANPLAVQADVLIAPHHGSAEPGSAAFIDAVSPRWVLCSNDRSLTGKQHRFDALAAGRNLLRTHTSGAITITIDPHGQITVEPFRAPNP